jgi:hypothetical protein
VLDSTAQINRQITFNPVERDEMLLVGTTYMLGCLGIEKHCHTSVHSPFRWTKTVSESHKGCRRVIEATAAVLINLGIPRILDILSFQHETIEPHSIQHETIEHPRYNVTFLVDYSNTRLDHFIYPHSARSIYATHTRNYELLGTPGSTTSSNIHPPAPNAFVALSYVPIIPSPDIPRALCPRYTHTHTHTHTHKRNLELLSTSRFTPSFNLHTPPSDTSVTPSYTPYPPPLLSSPLVPSPRSTPPTHSSPSKNQSSPLLRHVSAS